MKHRLKCAVAAILSLSASAVFAGTITSISSFSSALALGTNFQPMGLAEDGSAYGSNITGSTVNALYTGPDATPVLTAKTGISNSSSFISYWALGAVQGWGSSPAVVSVEDDLSFSPYQTTFDSFVGGTELANVDVQAVSSAGYVLGWNTSSNSVLYGPGDSLKATLASGDAGRAVNDTGQVTGSDGNEAFLTGANGQGVTLLGLGDGTSTMGAAINDSGVVAGTLELASGQYDLFVTGPDGVGITDVGDIGSDTGMAVTGINSAGDVVGYEQTSAGTIAFLYQNGQLFNLDSLVTDSAVTGLSGLAPEGIDDAGQVLVWGTSGGTDETYLLQPTFSTSQTGAVPEPFAVSLLGLGVLGVGFRRGSRRKSAAVLSAA